MKDSIRKKINMIKEKKSSLNSVIDSNISNLKSETDAKTAELEALIKNAKETRKNKILEQKKELQVNYKKQNEKLVSASVKSSQFLL